MLTLIRNFYYTPAVVGPPAVPAHWNWGRVIVTIVVVGLLVWLLAFGGLATVQSWLPKPAPATFDISKCAKFDPATGYPLDEAASKSANDCKWPKLAAPAAFDIAKCNKFDPTSGYPLDEAASKTAGACKYAAPAAPPAPTTTSTLPVSGQQILVIPARGEADIPQGWSVSGDIAVWVNGRWAPLYDNLAETGLVVKFNTGARIYAQWGAHAWSGPAATKVEELRKNGCEGGRGCATVHLVEWR